MSILCPFCLAPGEPTLETPQGSVAKYWRCSNMQCHEHIPASYYRDYGSYSPAVVNAIGGRAHGKTVYFAALFYALEYLRLEHCWPQFFKRELDEQSLQTIVDNACRLHKGDLPQATARNFPRPTMLRLEGLPQMPRRTLLMYDTAGECFERPSQMIRYAGFVKRASTVMLMFNIAGMEDPQREMHRMLTNYLSGIEELCAADARRASQHLVVVFTQADRMRDRLARWPDLDKYLLGGSTEGLSNMAAYRGRLRHNSQRLDRFVRSELEAEQFLRAAQQNFRSVNYCLVSALGAQPTKGKMSQLLAPRRILDPLFWVLENSLPAWKRCLRAAFA